MARITDVTAEVLVALADYPEGRTLSEIAKSLGRATSSVQRALGRMTRDGMLHRVAGTRPRYRLNERAPTGALIRVARWSLPMDRVAAVKKRTRGTAARRAAARRLGHAAPKSEAERWVPGAVERIVNQFDPTRIVLFGSQARGEARWDSDFDFVVVLPHVEHPREAALEVRRALRDLPVAKDVVVVSQATLDARESLPGTPLYEALTDGITVYERAD